jgi:hypothetical protein
VIEDFVVSYFDVVVGVGREKMGSSKASDFSEMEWSN